MTLIGKYFSLAFAGLLLLAAAGCSPTPRLAQEHLPVINGTPDQSPEHRAVVFTETSAGGWVYYCSGTLIAPTIVLTAAHCAEGWEPSQYLVHFGFDSSDFEDREVSEIIYHPNWDPDEFATVGFDIALLRLSLPAPPGIAPIPYLPQSLAITRDDLGMPLEFVGFGKDENGQLGRKLHITLPLWEVCTSAGGCTATNGAHLAFNTICHSMADGGGTCSGDSGGPAFVNIAGEEYVAGVTSYGDTGCHVFGCSTKVDVYEAWINDFIGSFSVNGQVCTNSAQCYSGFCVDGVCCENACDAPCMTCAGNKTAGTCTPAPDDSPCDDGEPCNGPDSCLQGSCISGNTPPDCTPANPCLEGICQPGQGCVTSARADGSDCDNGNQCDGADACQQGQCLPTGPSRDCDDNNPCTTDSCDPHNGCVHVQVADGTSCADGLACNGEETCQAGNCQSTGAMNCDDANACTSDSCDDTLGCQHEQMPEGSNCGEGRTCQKGLCLPAPSSGCATGGRPVAGLILPALALLVLARRRRRA